jgi:cyclic-di-GMP-binding protein
MSTEIPIRLRVPEQDLDTLTLFQPRVEAAREWAHHLPIANPEGVVQQLVEALSEINRCRMAPELRFNILAELQGNLAIATASLCRRFLNQPLVMPEEPRRQAEMIDTLISLGITAYTSVAIETLNDRDSVRGMNPARLVCEAILKALEFGGRKLLLNFQLHKPVEPNGWLTLHQLYALGERQELARIAVKGSDGRDTSISSRYLVAMMLGCCKPNQLRQTDLATIYDTLKAWSDQLSLSMPGAGEGLFLVDLERDQPPLYSSLYRNQASPQCRKIDTGALITRLEQLQALERDQGRGFIQVDDNTRLSATLLSHLIDSLGTMSVRNFSRKQSPGPLLISIGLSAAHYHAAGNRSFGQSLYGDNYIPPASDRVATNPFAASDKKGQDMWSQANPEEDFVRDSSESEFESLVSHQVELDEHTAHAITHDGPELPEDRPYPSYEVQMVNASPGGYCLEWSEQLPADVKAGELVSVQEEPNGSWVIAVIRWISQLESQRTLLGLELLSPGAKAFGAITRQKTGEEPEPLRVLLLPEIKLVGQPHTLLTPRAGFREKQKIDLVKKGEKLHVQLQRQVATTGSYSQFEFRYIQLLGDVIAGDKSGPLDSSYDSVWSNI